MKYVDVILPLPLDGTFTYSVPDGMEGNVVPGVRLLVPLGKSKKYIAMATRLHDDKPAFSCKPVEAVLDNTPSLLPQQMVRAMTPTLTSLSRIEPSRRISSI